MFGPAVGDAAGQAMWEAVALRLALKAFGKSLAAQNVRLVIRSGNMATIVMAIKFCRGHRGLNAVGAHLSWALEWLELFEVVTAHVAGKGATRAGATGC